jgi:peptidoglycan/LPS O-acetylase OafA/YrhL
MPRNGQEHRLTRSTASPRLEELDALRGIAAVLVVFHHAWLLLPREPGTEPGVVDFLLAETPLRVLSLGRPAVIFFFVLSGYVLVCSLLYRPVPWPTYALRRVVRLAPPVMLSVLASWLLWRMTWAGPLPPEAPDFASATWSSAPTAETVLRQGLLLNTNDDNGLNPVLWSLVHEWRIGLLLPLALLFRSTPPALVAVGLLTFAVAVLSGAELDTSFLGPDLLGGLLRTLYFVLPFAVGAALALAGPLPRLSAAGRFLLGIGVLVAMQFSDHDLVSVAGSALLIVLALQRGAMTAWLKHRVPLWLGRVSFSLYLVHLPVMTAVLHALAGHLAMPTIIVLSLPVALGGAVLMHAAAERPAQRLARNIMPAAARRDAIGRVRQAQLAGPRG